MTENSTSTESEVGRDFVGAAGIAVATAVLLAAILGVLGLLIALWPPADATSASRVAVFGHSFTLNQDQRLFCVVALAGALGGLLHSTRSLYWYVGNRALKRSWLTMYLCLPFVGSAMAVVFYIVLRGGLVPAQGGPGAVNVFGFAAVAALVGLFSPQAAEKLKQIFNTLLTPAEAGKDQVPAPGKPRVSALDPASGPVGTQVRLTGTLLSAATEVIFGDAAAAASVVSAAELTTTVPQGATTGSVRVKVGDMVVTGPQFEVRQ